MYDGPTQLLSGRRPSDATDVVRAQSTKQLHCCTNVPLEPTCNTDTPYNMPPLARSCSGHKAQVQRSRLHGIIPFDAKWDPHLNLRVGAGRLF
jgi:hypothetical protein